MASEVIAYETLFRRQIICLGNLTDIRQSSVAIGKFRNIPENRLRTRILTKNPAFKNLPTGGLKGKFFWRKNCSKSQYRNEIPKAETPLCM